MTKPVIFIVSAAWDEAASVWTGHCDAIPAAADAATLDELVTKISAMTRDLLADNHPGIDPANVFLQFTALCEVDRRKSTLFLLSNTQRTSDWILSPPLPHGVLRRSQPTS